MLATFYHIDIPGIIVWTTVIATVMLATFYYLDIPGIIVWTIIRACNTSYVLYQECIMNSTFYHIDIPGIINLCFYCIV